MLRHRLRATLAPVLVAMAASTLAAHDVAAQLAHASASTLGLAGNNTATVRGFGAISVNPAGLAMPGSGFSLALAPVQVRDGLHPVTLGDVFDYGGERIPVPTKEEWLTRLSTTDGESGAAGVDVTAIAMTIGHFGLQVSTVASTNVTLPPGVAEAMLYGNAGRTGSAADLSLTDAAIDGFAATTVGVSLGVPLGRASVGATVKYTHGHVMALGRSTSGLFESDPLRISLEFPAVATCADPEISGCTQDFTDGGHGFGLDLGWMLDLPALSLGASVSNVINTFAWDPAKLGFRSGTALLERGDKQTDFDELDYASAPAALQAAVEDMTFKPTLQLGAALDLSSAFTVSADIHRRLGDGGIALSPKTHAGVGAEFRGLGLLHLRGGFAAITGGVQYGGGASIVLGPVNFSGAIASRRGDDDMLLAQFGLSFGNR